MRRHTHNNWVVLSPPFADRSVAHRVFLEYAQRLALLVEQHADDADPMAIRGRDLVGFGVDGGHCVGATDEE